MGNTHAHQQGHGRGGDRSPESMGASPPDSPGPHSHITFSPQVAMNPIQHAGKTDQGAGPSGAVDIPDMAHTPIEPRLIPTVITWSHGGSVVEVQGSFDNWTTRTPLHQQGKDFTIVKMLPPAVYQYKFIVDGEWKYAPDQPAMYDELGNVNNVLEVQEYIPENLESLTGFQAPASPPSSYNQMLPQPDDYAKEPPAVPPQLLLTLLNCPNTNEGLPRPQHVILNHLYSKRSKAMTCSGITHRYRSKYVTVVMYKPERRDNK